MITVSAIVILIGALFTAFGGKVNEKK